MIRVYDFDNTIFRGDSTARFCAYSLLKRPRLLLRLPAVAMAFLAMALGVKTKTRAKETLYRALLSDYEGVSGDIESFWDKNMPRIKQWYTRQAAPDDVIISASPEFLLKTPCERLGVRLIASRVDEKTGAYTGLNCHGREKVSRYEAMGLPADYEFYSDSLSDEPMARKARKAFLVKGDEVIPWYLGGKLYANNLNKG